MTERMKALSLDQLRALVDLGRPGTETVAAVLSLVERADADSAARLRAHADRIGGAAGNLARAASFLVEGDFAALVEAARADPSLLRASLVPSSYLSGAHESLAPLFVLWIDAVKKSASQEGVTAYRALVGDVAEVAFRAHRRGADARRLLGEGAESFLDILCAELPGTTDLLAARSMVWLLGVLLAEDDVARGAIERARARFHEAAFLADCDEILAGTFARSFSR